VGAGDRVRRAGGFVQGVYPAKDALLHRFAERYVAVREGSV
jgi:hypothetical protein